MRVCDESSASVAVAVNVISVSSGAVWFAVDTSRTGATLTSVTISSTCLVSESDPSDTDTSNVNVPF